MASAILTKYLGPTNTKGARIAAWRADRVGNDPTEYIAIPYPDGLDHREAFDKAAVALIVKCGFPREGWTRGAVAGGTVYVHGEPTTL